MAGLRRCDSCGVVMGGSGDACPICSMPYGVPVDDRVVDVHRPGATAIDTPAATSSTADATGGRDGANAGGETPVRAEPAVAERTLVSAGAPTDGAAASATTVEPPAPLPTHRPDPYAQITNPLHTNWGVPTAAPPAQPRPIAPHTRVRRRSPWLRRAAIFVVLALLAGAAWLNRDRIADAMDDLRDRISEDGDAIAAPPVAPVVPVVPDPTRAYLEWEQANESSIVPLMKEWTTRTSALDTAGDDIEAGLGEIAGARDAVQALAILVDGAPDSQIRSDILSLLLNFMAACDDLARLRDTGDEAYYQAAMDHFDAAIADEQRFSDTYGTESIFLG